MNNLAILGAGGHARVIADAAESTGQWSKIVMYDDSWPERKQNGVWQIAGDISALYQSLLDFAGVVVAIGNNRTRLKYSRLLSSRGGSLTNIIHSDATVSRYASIGPGCVIFAGAVVNIAAQLGVGCIINTGSTVDHDCILGDGVHVCPGAHLAGSVTVGKESWIGIGSCVRQELTIGQNVTVGAGATVVKPVTDGLTVVGTPAQMVKSTN